MAGLKPCLLAHVGLGPNWPWLSHLGAEYHCVSKSLVQGKGFTDPFTAPTGPTAWMPPILPVLMASVTWLLNEAGLFLVFCLSQFAVVSATLARIVQVARREHSESMMSMLSLDKAISKRILGRTMLFAVPMLVFRVPIPRIYWIAAGLLNLYLEPYVLITYYDRYVAPLVAIKATMVVAFLGAIKQRSTIVLNR